MSMFTSLLPPSHGLEERYRLSPRAAVVTEILKEAGYTAVGFYAVDWLHPALGFGRGFDRYERLDTGVEVLEETRAVLSELATTDDPFFLFVHLMDIHADRVGAKGSSLYNAPPQYRDSFLPYPEVDTMRYPNYKIYQDQVVLTRKERENVIARYDGGILYADWIVGQVLQQMKKLGVYERTLIVVTSDHGESLGDHGTFAGHGLFWESGLRVPLLVKLTSSNPRRERWRGARIPYRVQSVDLAPTILSVAGLRHPPSFQGKSLLVPGDRVVIAYRAGAAALIDGR
jgi:arylsulfatase A-like enzyme